MTFKLVNCPSRRANGLFANGFGYGYVNATGIPAQVARCDYAALVGSAQVDEIDGGPTTLAEGDSGAFNWGNLTQFTGIIYRRSQTRMGDITAGTSNIYLLGEKYLNPANYYSGLDAADNETMLVGFDNDLGRCTYSPPMKDQLNYTDTFRFGSNHVGGLNMLYCDGGVRYVNYTIDPTVHFLAGVRNQ
jgi:prepilin-type processing-associated H-X9-DG protein